MRRAQISGALGALIGNFVYLYLGKSTFSQMPSASSNAKEFVEAVANDHGISNDFQIKVGDGYAAGMGTVVLEHNNDSWSQTQTRLDKAIEEYANAQTEEEFNSALEKLDEHIGLLDHEFTHYKNRDVRNFLISSSVISVGLLAAFLMFEHKFLSHHLEKSSKFNKWVYSYVSGIGISIACAFLTCWYKCKQEKHADEGVRNDINVLNAMVKWAQRLQQEIKDRLKNSNWFGKKFGQLLEKYPSLYLLLDPIHPPLPEREARFSERLSQIKTDSVLSRSN
jgi:hypothetical protein